MNQSIKIKALNVEGDEIQFEIIATNGITSSSLDFYGYFDEFSEFGNKLIGFPANIDDVEIYELGEEDSKWAYYMQLKTYCYQSNGYSAIDVIINNLGTKPYQNKASFSITTLPALINKLGEILSSWNPKNQKEIEWIAE